MESFELSDPRVSCINVDPSDRASDPLTLDYFKNIYCVNLKRRPDRMAQFKSELNRINFHGVNSFLAVDPYMDGFTSSFIRDKRVRKLMSENDKMEIGKLGCTLSHMELIKLAKERNFDNILIFEDDCLFLDSFVRKIKTYIMELSKLEWDLFYLGGDPHMKCEKHTDHLYSTCQGIYCTHAYAVNSRMYDTILSFNPRVTIDISLVDCLGKRVFLSDDMAVVQSDGYSDLCHKYRKVQLNHAKNWSKFVN